MRAEKRNNGHPANDRFSKAERVPRSKQSFINRSGTSTGAICRQAPQSFRRDGDNVRLQSRAQPASYNRVCGNNPLTRLAPVMTTDLVIVRLRPIHVVEQNSVLRRRLTKKFVRVRFGHLFGSVRSPQMPQTVDKSPLNCVKA